MKSFNIQINQIIALYNFLGKDIEDNFFNDVKGQIKKIEEEQNNIMDPENEPDEPDIFAQNPNEEEEEDDDDIFGNINDSGDDGGNDRD